MASNKIKTNKAKKIEQVQRARIAVYASFNNTIITASALPSNNVIAWVSAGGSGFKGAKKSTPFAATTAMKNLLEKLQPYGIETIEVSVSGAGNGRDAALRGLSGSGLKIVKINESTPLPHNGVRQRKPRRN